MAQVPPPPPEPPGAPGAPVPPAPSPPESAERVRVAWQRRPETDYVFSFWTALGWSILTCGVYSFYVVYRLAQRDREHNLRRIDLLDGSMAFAWEQASARGMEEEVRPAFERMAVQMNEMRRLSTEFRDPVIWTLLCFVTGIAAMILWIFIDQDLVRHDRSEGAVEAELAAIFERLGAPVAAPDPGRLKGQHNYVGRVIALFATLGIYGLWWLYDIMVETNQHFEHNWAWEDDLAGSVQQLVAAA